MTADGLLAQRVDADHHLDRVVAEPARRRRRRARTTRGRPRRWRGRSRATSAAPAQTGHAVIWSRRSRITPSRSAHGQISSAARSKMSMHASATSAPGHDLVGAARRDAGQVGELVGRHRDQLGDPLDSVAGRSDARHERPVADGAAPQIRASERNVFEVAAAWSGAPARSRRPASRAMSARICLRSCADASSSGRVAGEVLAGQPGRAERQRPGDVGRLVGAAGDLQRAAADVEDRQPAGRPAEPAAYGEEGQPRLVLARQHRDRRPRSRSSTCVEHLVGVDRRRAPPRSRRRACPRSPCPRRPAAPGR